MPDRERGGDASQNDAPGDRGGGRRRRVGRAAGPSVKHIRSPAEVAARTAPPPLSLITAPVERRTLASDVVTRGTVRFGTPQTVTLPTSALKPGSRVVTVPPVKGATLAEGDVAMVVSGRPVLVLEGAQPAYRDSVPGTVGDDVRQLEEALARLGFDPGRSTACSTSARSTPWPLGRRLEGLGVPRADRRTTPGAAHRRDRPVHAGVRSAGGEGGFATARGTLTVATEKARPARTAADGAPAAEASGSRQRPRSRRPLRTPSRHQEQRASPPRRQRAGRPAHARRSARRRILRSPGAALETLEAALRAATSGGERLPATDLAAAQATAAAVGDPGARYAWSPS